MLTIQKTDKYSQFRRYDSNRPTQSDKLVESIKRKNLLESHPILIGKNNYVIDGHHRLEAAERLGIPVFYIKDESLGEEHISICQVSKSWNLNDFMNYYKKYNDDYEFIFQLRSNYPYISMKQTIYFCSKYDPMVLGDFRDGMFKIGKDKRLLRNRFSLFDVMCGNIRIVIGAKGFSVNAIRAIWRFMQLDDFDIAHFDEKLKTNRDGVKLAFTYKDSLNIINNLIDVYNYNARKAIRLKKIIDIEVE